MAGSNICGVLLNRVIRASLDLALTNNVAGTNDNWVKSPLFAPDSVREPIISDARRADNLWTITWQLSMSPCQTLRTFAPYLAVELRVKGKSVACKQIIESRFGLLAGGGVVRNPNGGEIVESKSFGRSFTR
jgi:hypothetical protein